MPRTTLDGRPLRRELEYHLNRDINDAEIAEALGKPGATFSRRKRADDFPTFEELNLIADHFDANPRWLQVQFGFLRADELKGTVNFERSR